MTGNHGTDGAAPSPKKSRNSPHLPFPFSRYHTWMSPVPPRRGRRLDTMTGAVLPMARRATQKPTRQVKTLAALVVSMTLGTFLLNWVHDLTPSAATTLRSVQTHRAWHRITLTPLTPADLGADGSIRCFYHFYVDGSGRLRESHAWRSGRQDPEARGAIRIVVSVNANGSELSPRQWRRLTELLSELQDRYSIDRAHIVTASLSNARRQSTRLSAMLKTR